MRYDIEGVDIRSTGVNHADITVWVKGRRSADLLKDKMHGVRCALSRNGDGSRGRRDV